MLAFLRLLFVLVLIALTSADGDSEHMRVVKGGSNSPAKVGHQEDFSSAAKDFCAKADTAGGGGTGSCPTYNPGKHEGLKLVRTMDKSANDTVALLRTNKEFQQWINSKPHSDVETASLLRQDAFRLFKDLDARAKAVESNFLQVNSAMFGRARGLVANRISYANGCGGWRCNENGRSDQKEITDLS